MSRLHPSIKGALENNSTVLYEVWHNGNFACEPDTHFCRITGVREAENGGFDLTLDSEDGKSYEFSYNWTQVQHDGRVFRSVVDGVVSRISIIL